MKINMEDLRVSLIQSALYWENHQANLEMFDEQLSTLKDHTDLIILPEMFTTGFSMHPEQLAEKMDGSSVEWMKKTAKILNATITGSLIIEDNNQYFNRLIWMNPNGNYEYYDKRHLFSLAKEDQVFSQGNKRLIVELKGWKICPLICYDLRFPVWSRNTENYDVLIYTANFPAKRRYAWRHLLRARAIENQCYVLGVNIVGKDGNHFEYSGDSSIIDPKGHLIKELTDKQGIIQYSLQYNEVQNIRTQLPFLNDRDLFEIK